LVFNKTIHENHMYIVVLGKSPIKGYWNLCIEFFCINIVPIWGIKLKIAKKIKFYFILTKLLKCKKLQNFNTLGIHEGSFHDILVTKIYMWFYHDNFRVLSILKHWEVFP
jgi:hypothetical protein